MKKAISLLSVILALLMICSVCGSAAGALTVTSVQYGDKALSGAAIDKSDVIVITFSGAVLNGQEANAALIGVYDKAGAKADYTVHPVDSAQPNVVKVQLHDLAAAGYKLVIGAGVTADDGSVLAEPQTVSFSVKGEAAPEACQHICHSENRVAQFIWNFMNKIFKFFKINQYCECGEAHW